MDQPLGDVTSMALRDEEEVESDVLARCRQRIRDAVRSGCDWSNLICIRLSLEDEVDRMMATAWDPYERGVDLRTWEAGWLYEYDA